MTKLEMLDVFALFSIAYPSATQFRGSTDDLRDMATFWADLCSDIGYDNGIAAAKELCKTSKFCPSIAEFREAAAAVKDRAKPRVSAAARLRRLHERETLPLPKGDSV